MNCPESISLVKQRYLAIRRPEIAGMLRVQDEILSGIRDFLRSKGFVEILAPVIGPVTDPGIRGAKQVSIDYYGKEFKLMSSMILYKQMVICCLKKVFALSPNVRLEPLESIATGRHLAEFRQVDIEQAFASYEEMIELAEQLFCYLVKRIKERCKEDLKAFGRELRVPSRPFKRVKYSEAIELLRSKGYKAKHGEEIPWDAEEALSKMHKEPFFIVEYPKSARGFYDLEDPRKPGILRDFDMLYPEGFGEAISGGEREHTYEKVLERIRAGGEDPGKYGWYLKMLKLGIPPSAGFGIGVERLTRYICGLKRIWQAVPFPKVPGILSP
jgi:asparaginyl-tRNA synthetase